MALHFFIKIPNIKFYETLFSFSSFYTHTDNQNDFKSFHTAVKHLKMEGEGHKISSFMGECMIHKHEPINLPHPTK